LPSTLVRPASARQLQLKRLRTTGRPRSPGSRTSKTSSRACASSYAVGHAATRRPSRGHGPGRRRAVSADRQMWLLSPALISLGAFADAFAFSGMRLFCGTCGKGRRVSGRWLARHNGDQASLR
jgi:hypothetical protein